MDNQTNSHAYDGSDIDNPTARPLSRRQWADKAREDLVELQAMSPAELAHYSGHKRRPR